MAASSTSMDSPPASFRQSHRFARFASTRILFRPSTTSSATDASKFLPSPAPTNFTDSFPCVGNDSAFNSRNPFLGDAEQLPYDSVIYKGTSAAQSARGHRFFWICSAATSMKSRSSTRRHSASPRAFPIRARAPTSARASTTSSPPTTRSRRATNITGTPGRTLASAASCCPRRAITLPPPNTPCNSPIHR